MLPIYTENGATVKEDSYDSHAKWDLFWDAKQE